jgi:tetratricopeptide (TPR) repeat protein
MTPRQREAYRLGRQGFERGDTQQTLAQLTRLLPACRDYADVHYMMGVSYERVGDLDSAVHALEEALRINPRYAEALVALASVYEARGEYERSSELSDQVRASVACDGERLDPTTRGKLANLHAALGDAYRDAGELGEAIEAYRKALDRCPDFHDIRVRLAATLRDGGYPDRAIRELLRVRRAHPQLVEAGVQLGLTFFSLGQTARAVDEWRAVLERNPARDDARTYIRMVHALEERAQDAKASPAAEVGPPIEEAPIEAAALEALIPQGDDGSLL